jgi:hypothetical protein
MNPLDSVEFHCLKHGRKRLQIIEGNLVASQHDSRRVLSGYRLKEEEIVPGCGILSF